MSPFLTRTLTGFGFAAVMAAGIFGGHKPFVVLFLVVTSLCLWEFYGLILRREAHQRTRQILGVVIGAAIYSCVSFFATGERFTQDAGAFALFMSLGVIGFFGIIISFAAELFLESEKPFENIAYLILGQIYITVPFVMLTAIAYRQNPVSYLKGYEPALVFGLLLLTWASDSFAYIVGSRIGKHKLFPRISPGKTWEGSAGGLVGAAIAAGLIHTIFPDVLPFANWLILAAMAVVFGTLGDLIESMLKRSLALKDSGSVLPGHGGMLDRFDAFIYLLPWAWFYLTLFAI